MEKLRIVRRGRYWTVLEGKVGLDVFETKQDAYEELDYLRRERRDREMEVPGQMERIRRMYLAR